MDFIKVLSNLEKEGNLRVLPKELPEGFLDFSSNDYLGLASDAALAREFIDKISEFKFSSSASRLLASNQKSYKELEFLIEREYGRAALIYNSGYHANTGIISAIASDSNCMVIADKLVHASIIDGVILSRCEFRRFNHNNIESLKKILEKNYNQYDHFLVITESVFSMDGDYAPLPELLELKRNYPKIILYLDEAHAFGVKGKHGLGFARDTENPNDWDIIVNPLGKAAASSGAFVVCDESTKDFLVNKSRSLIFSTALPPLQIQWTTFIFQKILKMDSVRNHLENLALKLSHILEPYSKSFTPKDSHIQPLIIGSSQKAIEISEVLYENGIKSLPIRKPTVPAGTERLRFSLSAKMEEKDIEKLGEVLKNKICSENI